MLNHHALIHSKIVDASILQKRLAQWRADGLKIVFTNGCFDLLHRGHIDYLSKAADLGDLLFIGVNTDASVSKLKGPLRPIQDEDSRMLILASLESVGAVMRFNEDTPYNLIKAVQPDILVKGADYKPEDIVGYDIVTRKGGQVITLDYLPGFSTSAIERRVRGVS